MVILQGDCYRKNVVFKYQEEEEEGMQIKMFYFQVMFIKTPRFMFNH